jgi:hypothetical protein
MTGQRHRLCRAIAGGRAVLTGTLRFTHPAYTFIRVFNYFAGTVALAHPYAPRHSNILSIVALLFYPSCMHAHLGYKPFDGYVALLLYPSYMHAHPGYKPFGGYVALLLYPSYMHAHLGYKPFGGYVTLLFYPSYMHDSQP